MEKILDIIEAIAHEKNISRENTLEAFKDALINTAKKLTTPSSAFEIIIDNDIKTYTINKVITVVLDNDEKLEEEPDAYISLSEAKGFDNSIEVGDQLKEEFILEDHGRTASANLFKELEYHVQRRVEQDLFEKYREKVGTVMLGTVNRIDTDDNTHIEIGELKGILTRRNRIKGESFKRGDTIRTLLRYVSVDPQYGLFLELTRTSPKFLEALMASEVPEISDGAVEIVAAARIPGERAKITLKTDQMNIDPIGAAVGVKGVRINAVSAELNGENIDCIEYSPIPEIFITRALSPAITQSVKIDQEEKKAIIDITGDQKAKAIGKSGINIRLASMLTGYDIQLNEIEGVTERQANSSSDTPETTKTTDTSALENLFR
ncbi:MAG: transcription termination factor NusA [Sulfurovum sp.]|nr:transcription termination factor NusA [Sulfurovum sp.]MCB4750765.1 transcription termination factor NusA [Sulfurovum sp.]MCB4754844.1 transcription termination factor NusA [Sulfurovum sp.]MCB4762891.1 transcription termination factor NusA [Sulfurovum sp.]MCB4774341.1 transcription termination factor NusA [Sulfurovum sp.]